MKLRDMRGLSRNRRKQLAKDLPNDRLYSRQVEQIIRELKPQELDVLLNGEEDERLNLRYDTDTKWRKEG